MRKYIGIILLLITELIFMRLWLVCKELRDFFYFSVQNVQLIIIDHIHNDVDMPLLLVRVLHNKITVSIVEFIRHYLFFWDIRFLIPFISPVGLFAVIAGFWYLIRSQLSPLHKSIVLAVLLSIPVVEMVLKPQIPFMFRLIFISVPYIVLSLIGIWHFLETKKPIRYGIFAVLLLFSFWWFLVFQHELTNLCVNP